MDARDFIHASDRQLVREFVREQSSRAFDTLVARHVDLVYSAAARQTGGDSHRAEEVTQMVFRDLAKKAASLASHPALTGWLYTSTRWAARSLLRAERRRASYEQQAAAMMFADATGEGARADAAGAGAVGADGGDSLDWDAVRPVLDEAMNRLDKTDREAVLLRFFKEESFAEVGAQIGLGENAARMRVRRALGKLRVLLARRGVTSSAAALGAALAANAVSAAPAGLGASVSAGAVAGAGAGVAGAGSGALAAAFAGLKGAVGIFIMSKITIVVVGIAAVALAIVGGLETRQARELEKNAAASRVRNERSALALASLRSRNDALRDEIAKYDALVAAVPDAAAKLEEERMFLIRYHRADDDCYAGLYRHLRLNPDDLYALRQLLYERDKTLFSTANAIAAKHGCKNDPVMKQAIRDALVESIDVRIGDLIGSENLEYFKFYTDSYSFRMDPMLKNGLAYLGIGATDDQLDALAKVRMVDDSPAASDAVWTEQQMSEAKKILSPEQFAFLEEWNNNAIAENRLAEMNRQAAIEGRLNLDKKWQKLYPASVKNGGNNQKESAQ